MSLENTGEIVNTLGEVLPLLNQLRDLNSPVGDVQKYIDQSSSCIRTLNRLLRGHLSQSDTRKCLSLLGQAEILKACFETFVIRGAGIQRPQLRGQRLIGRRVKWVELEQAFQNRISTSVVSNIKHIDVDNFLDDACTLFISKVNF